MAAKMIYSIVNGLPIEKQSPSLQLQSLSGGAALTIDDIRAWIDISADEGQLVRELGHSPNAPTETLISLLGNKSYSPVAIKVLVERGSSVIPSLQKAESSPSLREGARKALKLIVTGEAEHSSATLSSPAHSGSQSFPPSGDVPPGMKSISSLDLQKVNQALLDPITYQSTLKSLIQLGEQAIPPLCSILWSLELS
jgi:hypothetical protein